jgi:hypothetical protein
MAVVFAGGAGAGAGAGTVAGGGDADVHAAAVSRTSAARRDMKGSREVVV